MERLYFALVDTPGFFASIIRRVIKQNYIHVVISMDPQFENAYTVGRRDPAVPIFAGFTREYTDKVLRQFPGARYKIFSMPCEPAIKEKIHDDLKACYEQRFRYHYCIIGLFFVLFQKPFYQKNHYTCSSYIARLLEDNGMPLFDKHFSLVTPKDFSNLEGVRWEYEGLLRDFVATRDTPPLALGGMSGELNEA